MPKFIIEAKRTLYVSTVVEAESYEEAEKMYDNDLIAEDYDLDNSDWTLESITEEAE
jgi:hypothetical protein